MTVSQNTTTLYKTTTDQEKQENAGGNITFTLPKDEEQVHYRDENGILQIVPENIPSIRIRVEDPNGHKLDTVANVTTVQGIVKIGSVKENTIKRGNASFAQIAFSKANDFIIEDGLLDITLYPTFKAGDDTLVIQIP